jgi:hypothetical protein
VIARRWYPFDAEWVGAASAILRTTCDPNIREVKDSSENGIIGNGSATDGYGWGGDTNGLNFRKGRNTADFLKSAE